MIPRHLVTTPSPVQILTMEAAPLESFHDCYVYGMRWVPHRFSFVVDLDYICQWIAPSDASGAYRFAVSRGSLVFANADDVNIALDWTGSALEAQLSDLRLDGHRETPNGSKQLRYQLEFSNLNGAISLWATSYELQLWTPPQTVDTPWLDGAT